MFLEFHESYAVAIKKTFYNHWKAVYDCILHEFKTFLPVSTEPHGPDVTRNEGTEQQEDVCFGNVV